MPKRPRTLVYFDAHLDLQQISPSRLRRLADCTTPEQIRSLKKLHHLCPDEGFSYSIEDFLYPAHRLGLIERVVWVAPPHVLSADPQVTLERMQQMDGVTFDELMAFHRDPHGIITGQLLGVDLKICDVGQLQNMELPADSLVDIDIDFFIALPDEKPWVLPRMVFEITAKLVPNPDLVTISRSVTSGFTPLRYRFLADHLEALYCGRKADGLHFDRLLEIDSQLHAGNHEIAAESCRFELKSHPDCVATLYLLGLASPDPQESQNARRQAALNPAYRESVLREACEFPSRMRALDLAAVRDLEQRLDNEQLDEREAVLSWAAIGILHCQLGRVESARQCYRKTIRYFPQHPELANAIAVALVRVRRPDEAMPYLDVAVTCDKTSAGAHMLLATIDANQGNAKRALEHLQTATTRAPAWIHLRDMQAAVHAAMGDHQTSAELRRLCADMRVQAARLARQIRPN